MKRSRETNYKRYKEEMNMRSLVLGVMAGTLVACGSGTAPVIERNDPGTGTLTLRVTADIDALDFALLPPADTTRLFLPLASNLVLISCSQGRRDPPIPDQLPAQSSQFGTVKRHKPFYANDLGTQRWAHTQPSNPIARTYSSEGPCKGHQRSPWRGP